MKKRKRLLSDSDISIIENLLKFGLILIFISVLIFVTIAMVDRDNQNEASIGNFDKTEFNTGWKLADSMKEITLPYETGAKKSDVIYIVNTLPKDVSDGMTLFSRASLQDIYIYIDGELREGYATENIEGMSFNIPSAYIAVNLNKEDAGKEVKIGYRIKANSLINEVSLAYGNNAWFSVLQKGMAVNLSAVIVLVLGIMMFFIVLFLGGALESVSAVRYLGLTMIDVAIWVLSESEIRQLIFSRPSLSSYFSFLSVELIGVFGAMFFDSVQHKVYHKRYLLVEALLLGQLLLNLFLHLTGIREFYDTLIFSHIWSAACILLAIVCLFNDIKRKRIKEYNITAIGMCCFAVMTFFELLSFYLTKLRIFGVYICIGLIILMVATIIQTLYDERRKAIKRERKQTEMTVKTIETIAGSIDAKDEYTGGHSERVAFYAGMLAREMAADYNLSEEDILRIQYIGLVHDIGKIGVADNVLNKSGRLSDEEFNLMKKHSEIGYELMLSLGESIDGLLDGIRHHHERFDGKGYPDGLADTDIPLVARILSLADSYDAMTSNRVYRKRLSDEEVKNELKRCAGTQFDPALTEIFLRLIEKGELKANTIDGCATDTNGVVRASAKLEHRLQTDLLAGKDIINPTHVRMMCYVMKLMEKRGKDYHVFFVEFGNKSANDYEKTSEKYKLLINGKISNHDINITYCENSKVFSLFDKSDDEFEEFVKDLSLLNLSVEKFV